MAKLTRRTVVQAVLESTYGTDPGSGYQGLLARQGTQLQISGEQITRDTLRDTLSPRGHVIGTKQQEITLPLELRGAGLDGSSNLQVPEIDPLLQSCSMAREDGARLALTGVTGTFERGETVTNDTASEAVGTVADVDGTTLYIRDLQNMPSASDSISGDTSSADATVSSTADTYVYRPDSPDIDQMPSAAIHYFRDGIRHLCLGARGTFTADLTVGQIPGINFTMTALYAGPTDTPNASPSYLSLVPSPVFGANLTIGSLDTSLVAVNALTADLGNTVNPRDDIQAPSGRKAFLVTERDPTGSVDPEVTTLANFDPYTDWEDGNEVALAAGIGSSDGERVRVVMPATQYTELPYGERNGILTYQLGYRATGTDDELMLIFS